LQPSCPSKSSRDRSAAWSMVPIAPSARSTRSARVFSNVSGMLFRLSVEWGCLEKTSHALESPIEDYPGDPRDDLVEHLVERGGPRVAEHVARLAHVGHPLLHVVLERVVRDVPERHPVSLDLLPDQLGEL